MLALAFALLAFATTALWLRARQRYARVKRYYPAARYLMAKQRSAGVRGSESPELASTIEAQATADARALDRGICPTCQHKLFLPGYNWDAAIHCVACGALVAHCREPIEPPASKNPWAPDLTKPEGHWERGRYVTT